MARENIKKDLTLISFIEDGVHILYSPDLDLPGYGYTEDEAKQSFRVALEAFLQYRPES